MAQQKSEDCTVPKGPRKLAKTRRLERHGGGKAVPVEVAGEQLALDFVTAEHSRETREAESVSGVDLSAQRAHKVPKAKDNHGQASPVTMSEVVEHLDSALDKVVANQGAPGPDGQTVDHVHKHWPAIRRKLVDELTKGTYHPGPARRVWIPKPDKGQRGLGIPNVVDRVVQEALRAVLEPHYEPNFHPSSHGFRPHRSCHTAIAAAKSYIEEGYHIVVDIDLSNFFDRVHHQRLLSKLAVCVSDRNVLVLIGRMLKSGVLMPDGVKVATEEGVPQGGPLSPLLSNIVLDELDRELQRRGLRFVRYADDCNIYVRSERAGQRVMAKVTSYIHRKLRLEVNAKKSAVANPKERHFLGFRLVPQGTSPPEVLLSERSEKRLRERLRMLTKRNRGRSLRAVIASLNSYLRGWREFFSICTSGVLRTLQNADAHMRRRLRAMVLKQWKTKRTTVKRLLRLGVHHKTALKSVYQGRKSLWALSHTSAADVGLRKAYFSSRGLETLREWFEAHWADIAAPRQPELFAEAERPKTGRRRGSQPVVPKSRM